MISFKHSSDCNEALSSLMQPLTRLGTCDAKATSTSLSINGILVPFKPTGREIQGFDSDIATLKSSSRLDSVPLNGDRHCSKNGSWLNGEKKHGQSLQNNESQPFDAQRQASNATWSNPISTMLLKCLQLHKSASTMLLVNLHATER